MEAAHCGHCCTLNLAYERISHLHSLNSTNFRLDKTLVYSRIWLYKEKKSNPTYTKAIANEGCYTVRFNQLLYGIPYFACNDVYDDGWKGK